MRIKVDISGKRFGFLIAKEPIGQTKAFKTIWLCLCDCGEETEVVLGNLKSGTTVSCGCMRSTIKSNLSKIRSTTHGHGKSGERSPTYNSWRNMRERCNNPRNPNHRWYGYLKVKICERWNNFADFLSDMGLRPEGKTLDRYPDPYGDYKPANCRWATPKQQTENRRSYKQLLIAA